MSMTALISNIENIEFAQPHFLWLFLALPILWLRFRGHSPAIIIWRSLIVLLLIVGVADPRLVSVTERTIRQENIFAFDLSKSVPASMRLWMERAAQNGFMPRQGDRIFVFGSETKEAANWRQWLGEQVPQLESIRPEKTNLDKLFTTLLSLPHGSRNLFLFTDGWETEGNLQRLFPAIAASGLKVFPILPADPPKIGNVAVTKLLAPNHGESGEAVMLKVVLENQSDRQIDGTLALMRNGQAVKSDPVKLKPGSQIFSYSSVLPEGQLTSYRATFTPRDPALDAYAPDNQAFAWISVRSKSKVLLLNGRNGAGRNLEELLKRKGFEVTSRLPDSPPPPAGFGVVIFNNVEREKLTPNYLAAIEKHVAGGNGFLMLGNEASFGPGGFRRTPIEAVLPVEPKEPKREERNRAIVLVIDKSGSMREDNRIVYAQEAAKAVARQLKDNDLIGVVGFDISPFIVVEMDSVGRLRKSFGSQIDRLRPGGQTFFYPALIEAKRQLEKQTAGRKHIILLSDGETRGSQGELIDLVNVMKTEMKITVSAVAIGREADIPVMKRISQYGGGLFHHIIDPTTLPQVVLQQMQAQDKADEPPPERDLTPIQEKTSEILAGFGGRAYPAIRALMETDLKRGAQLDLSIVRENRKVPLLASWRYGRGKAVALTMDMEGQWSRNWIQWNGLQGFWDKMMDWLGPTREPIPNHELRISVAANQPVLDLYLYEESNSESQFRFSISGKESKNGTLKRLARGHFQSSLPISRPGDYQIEITEERNGRRLSYPKAGYTLPHDLNVELPQPRFNLNLLNQLASVSTGEINPAALKFAEKQQVIKSYRNFREYLIALAALLFLLEVGFRKLVLAEVD